MLRSKSLRPIPGYDGAYQVSPEGQVFNKKGLLLRSYETSRGPAVELHHQGQREKVLIEDILKKLEVPDDDI